MFPLYPHTPPLPQSRLNRKCFTIREKCPTKACQADHTFWGRNSVTRRDWHGPGRSASNSQAEGPASGTQIKTQPQVLRWWPSLRYSDKDPASGTQIKTQPQVLRWRPSLRYLDKDPSSGTQMKIQHQVLRHSFQAKRSKHIFSKLRDLSASFCSVLQKAMGLTQFLNERGRAWA